MANILKLQDQLKGLPDRALMQYAQNPTGEVPQYLVLGELQRRKNMRDEFQQSQAQAPQKTVAEDLTQQGIAQLQPQPQMQPQMQPQRQPGVAALPVPDTMFQEQSMAGGGIVAFDDGGEVDKYDEYGTRKFAAGDPVTSSVLGRAIDIRPSEASNVLYGALEAGRRGYEARLAQISKRLSELRGLLGLRQQTRAEQLEYETLKTEKDRINMQMGSLGADISTAYNYKPPAVPPAAPTQTEAPAPDGGIRDLAPPPPAAPTTPSLPGSGGISTKLGRATSVYTPEVMQQLKDLSAPIYLDEKTYVPPELRMEEAAQRVKDVQAAFGVSEAPYTEQAERLKKREGDIEKRRAQGIWEAVMQAGFATAAGTSPFALTNIGQGAMKGLQAYTDAREKLDASQEKLDAAQFALADAQNRFRQEGSKEAAADLRENRRDVAQAKREVAKDRVTAERQSQVFNRSDVQAQLAEAGRVQTTNLAQQTAERDLEIKLRQLDISKLSAEAQAAAAARPTEASFLIDQARAIYPNDRAKQTDYFIEKISAAASRAGTSTLQGTIIEQFGPGGLWNSKYKAILNGTEEYKGKKGYDAAQEFMRDVMREQNPRANVASGSNTSALDTSKWGKLSVSNP